MSGGELIGEFAQGALTARAVEPDHGEAADGHSHEQACLNCGAALIGQHCHACGQAAHVHKTLGAFFHDFLHGVFHFEGKIWRTLPALAFHPGRMTREYIDGRRASYVSPIALFLFAVFLTFAVVKNVPIDIGDFANVNVDGKSIRGIEANRAEIARLEKERAALVAQGKPTKDLDKEIEGRKSAIAAIDKLKEGAEQAASGKPAADAGSASAADDDLNIKSDLPQLDAAIKHMRENPQLALYKLQSNAYKFAWALIPLSVPFVWLLFPFSRRFGLYDHTVFVTYSLSFMLFLTTVLVSLTAIGVPVLVMGMNLIPPIHMFAQLRGTYGLSIKGALWRTFVLLMFAGIALFLFALLIAVEAGA